MDERWQQIERIYHAAREMDASARAQFLAKACAGDDDLRHEVESLLVQADRHESFLKSPAIEVEAEALWDEGLFSGERNPELESGTMIAHYRLAGKIGEGGMGEVYRALDTKLQRDVALKILPETMARNAQRMARFEREAQVLASLNHPNIAAIHGLEESNGIRALVMELVEGRTLAERLSVTPGSIPAHAGLKVGSTTGDRRAPMTSDDALPIARQIAEALECAHERGVIHRDLKPANVKITPEGTVKVLDFGLAKVLNPQDSSSGSDPANSPTLSTMATQAGMILGTASYMSPEQAKGQRVDRRCDIWAFGCVLYEMLAGRKAFGGETISDVLAAVIKSEPEWAAIPDTTPLSIQLLIHRCLQKDQRQRLQAIGDARIAIEETLSGSPLLPSPLPLGEGGPGRRNRVRVSPLQHDASDSQIIAALVRRHKGKLALAVALLLAFVTAGAYAVYHLSRPAAVQQTTAPTAPANMQISQLTTSGTALLAAISPGGKYVAYAQQDTGGQSLWLQQVATASAVEIVPPAGVHYIGLTFSPDGNYLDYVEAPQSGAQLPALYQAPVLGGQTHKLLQNVGSAVTFSPDGKRIAFVRGHSGGETQLVVANADGSGERVLASKALPQLFVPALAYGRPAWSPDGRVIALSEGAYSPWGWNPAVYDVRTGQEHRIGFKRWTGLEQMAWRPDGKGLLLEASDASTQGRPQIWRLSYPGGKLSRVTNDLNDYLGVSVTADGAALATVQTRSASNIWAAPEGEWDHPRRVTRGLSNAEGMRGMSWTLDGKIVYTSAANGINSLWLADPASNHTGELIQEGLPFKPSACGKAELIVFAALGRTASGKVSLEIWRANADGSGLKQLSHVGFNSEPFCSPDSRWVFYSSASRGNVRLWKVPIGGGKPVQLTAKGTSWTPTVSPDGKWILYYHSAGAQSPWEYTIRPFAGGKAVRTFPTPFIHRGNSRALAWMPDSRAFAYIVQIGGVSNIVAQPIDGGPVRQLTHYHSGHIFWFDISRRGKLALARGSQSSDVVLIRNFQ